MANRTDDSCALCWEDGVQFLSNVYRLSTDAGLKTEDGRTLVAKHYVSHPRPLMFREGIPHVLRSGLLENLRCRRYPG